MAAKGGNTVSDSKQALDSKQVPDLSKEFADRFLLWAIAPSAQKCTFEIQGNEVTVSSTKKEETDAVAAELDRNLSSRGAFQNSRTYSETSDDEQKDGNPEEKAQGGITFEQPPKIDETAQGLIKVVDLLWTNGRKQIIPLVSRANVFDENGGSEVKEGQLLSMEVDQEDGGEASLRAVGTNMMLNLEKVPPSIIREALRKGKPLTDLMKGRKLTPQEENEAKIPMDYLRQCIHVITYNDTHGKAKAKLVIDTRKLLMGYYPLSVTAVKNDKKYQLKFNMEQLRAQAAVLLRGKPLIDARTTTGGEQFINLLLSNVKPAALFPETFVCDVDKSGSTQTLYQNKLVGPALTGLVDQCVARTEEVPTTITTRFFNDQIIAFQTSDLADPSTKKFMQQHTAIVPRVNDMTDLHSTLITGVESAEQEAVGRANNTVAVYVNITDFCETKQDEAARQGLLAKLAEKVKKSQQGLRVITCGMPGYDPVIAAQVGQATFSRVVALKEDLSDLPQRVMEQLPTAGQRRERAIHELTMVCGELSNTFTVVVPGGATQVLSVGTQKGSEFELDMASQTVKVKLHKSPPITPWHYLNHYRQQALKFVAEIKVQPAVKVEQLTELMGFVKSIQLNNDPLQIRLLAEINEFCTKLSDIAQRFKNADDKLLPVDTKLAGARFMELATFRQQLNESKIGLLEGEEQLWQERTAALNLSQVALQDHMSLCTQAHEQVGLAMAHEPVLEAKAVSAPPAKKSSPKLLATLAAVPGSSGDPQNVVSSGSSGFNLLVRLQQGQASSPGANFVAGNASNAALVQSRHQAAPTV